MSDDKKMIRIGDQRVNLTGSFLEKAEALRKKYSRRTVSDLVKYLIEIQFEQEKLNQS